jgi:type IV pilus assembly protein PilV
LNNQIQIKSPRKDEKGFTLIEVLVAIVILCVGLLGMASLTVAIIKGNKLSNDLTTATTLAQDKMEDIRRASRTDYSNILDENPEVLDPPYEDYMRGVDVDDNTPASGMKSITLTVSWGGASKTDHDVELKTILTQ